METVNEAVERVRKWFDHQIDLISYYPSEVHRLIILSVRLWSVLYEFRLDVRKNGD